MQDPNTVQLARDCDAVQIPVGTPVQLPAGTTVMITQRLGGSFTVHADGGLFRISSENADALGLAADEAATPSAAQTSEPAAGPVEEGNVWDVLRNCYDPEIPVNIVDLGLVYDLHIENRPSGGSKVFVRMTLTAPGCGMGSVIAGDAQERILQLPGVEDAHVEIVWDPPWHPSMISASGRAALGMDSL